MKSGILAVCLTGVLFGLCACGSGNTTVSTNTESLQDGAGDGTPAYMEETRVERSLDIPQTGYTESVPSSYLGASDRPGTVECVEYESRDYAGNGGAVTKTAYVYLPFGYDREEVDTRYDIVYLMHGWTGHAGEYFEYGHVKNIIDNLIANGDIPPAIFVSPTFYVPGASNDFSASVAALRAFHFDFENHLMPAVEGRFPTYAASTSDADLKASRDHRFFGGFSLGSVTTWMQFCYDYDYISGFMPMSGSCWYFGGYGDFQVQRNVDFIQALVEENDLDERGFFIYQAVGTRDSVKEQTVMMAGEMLARPETFTPEHYLFYQKEGGQHDYDAIEEFLYNGLPIMLGRARTGEGALGEEDSDGYQREDVAVQAYFDTTTPIADVMADPAFGSWGRLIFPMDTGYWSGRTLGDLHLAWYNGIDPARTVEICNYLKSRALAGRTVFLDIYTEVEKAADPAKRDTGLFFFRGDEGAPTAIVNAGGGFSYVGAMHDSFPHCLELSRMGFNAFALIYRPGAQTACEDLARAIAFLHENASELGISMDGYSLWGGSAGGRMAAWLGAYGTESFGEAAYPRPSACIVNYTGLSEVTGAEPPTYSAVGTSDGIAGWRTMERRIEAIRANGTDAVIEIFDGLPHGFGLGTGTVAEGWLNDAMAFWEKNM